MAEPTSFSRLLTINGETIFKNNTAGTFPNEKVTTPDIKWLKSVYMVGDNDIDDEDAKYRYFTNAELKFTDTRLGANLCINNYPQFTPYADIRIKGRHAGRVDVTVHSTGNHGMGHFYSETFDDNGFNVFMQFGVPEFNSLLSFFSRSINNNDLLIAKTGRIPTLRGVGETVGTVAAFFILPVITVTVLVAKTILDFVLDDKPFNYYYLKPTMHTYYSTVNMIVNSMATELGILIPEFMTSERDAERMGTPIAMSKEEAETLASLAPDIIDAETNYIDVFAIANKAQILANKQIALEYNEYKDYTNETDIKGYLERLTNVITEGGTGNTPTLFEYIDHIVSASSAMDYLDPTKASTVPETASEDKDTFEPNEIGNYKNTDKTKSAGSIFRKNFDATVRNGGGYAIFRVGYPGSPSESLTNNVTDIQSNGLLKSVAKGAKDKRFVFAGGNILGDTVDSAMNAIVEVVSGVASGMTFGLSDVIQGILGGAYVDIPKAWDDSNFSLPRQTYKMSLVSNSAHPLAQLQNIYIPLAMILAGSLPLSAGKASYTSPFICSMFLKGMQEIELGMITDVSIQRGVTSLGFNKQKRPLSIEVTFTVTDLTNLMTASINPGMFDHKNAIVDDASPLGRYIKTLCSRDLLTDKYFMPKARIRITRKLWELKKDISPAALGMRAGSIAEGLLGGLVVDYSLNLSESNR